MTSLLKTILTHLSNAIIAIVIGVATYLINDKMKERNDESLYNQVRILNDIFELKQDMDSLKQR